MSVASGQGETLPHKFPVVVRGVGAKAVLHNVTQVPWWRLRLPCRARDRWCGLVVVRVLFAWRVR